MGDLDQVPNYLMAKEETKLKFINKRVKNLLLVYFLQLYIVLSKNLRALKYESCQTTDLEEAG